MSTIKIPFNKPYVAGNELLYVQETIQRLQTAGDGHFTRRCHDYLQSQIGCAKVLLTTSCTHALEMTALLLNLGPTDEVIVPSYTFVSTANAYALRGARPVFCDVTPDTLNMDPAHLERLISPRTRAIVPVHYGGVGCDMDQICA